jgi:hypothetical protein
MMFRRNIALQIEPETLQIELGTSQIVSKNRLRPLRKSA